MRGRRGISGDLSPERSGAILRRPPATKECLMPDKMRIAIGLPSDVTDEHLIYAKQLGCDGVVLATPKRLPGEERWEYEDLVRLREWVEGYGLRIESIQNTPHSFWMRVRLGEPGREAQLENYLQTIRNI